MTGLVGWVAVGGGALNDNQRNWLAHVPGLIDKTSDLSALDAPRTYVDTTDAELDLFGTTAVSDSALENGTYSSSAHTIVDADGEFLVFRLTADDDIRNYSAEVVFGVDTWYITSFKQLHTTATYDYYGTEIYAPLTSVLTPQYHELDDGGTHFRGTVDAEKVVIDASGFDGNLDSTITDVAALATAVDDLSTSGGGGGGDDALGVPVELFSANVDLTTADTFSLAHTAVVDDDVEWILLNGGGLTASRPSPAQCQWVNADLWRALTVSPSGAIVTVATGLNIRDFPGHSANIGQSFGRDLMLGRTSTNQILISADSTGEDLFPLTVWTVTPVTTGGGTGGQSSTSSVRDIVGTDVPLTVVAKTTSWTASTANSLLTFASTDISDIDRIEFVLNVADAFELAFHITPEMIERVGYSTTAAYPITVVDADRLDCLAWSGRSGGGQRNQNYPTLRPSHSFLNTRRTLSNEHVFAIFLVSNTAEDALVGVRILTRSTSANCDFAYGKVYHHGS